MTHPNLGEESDAALTFRKALKIEPEDPELYFALGKYDKALELGEMALQAIPDNEKHYLDSFARIKMGMAEIYRMKRQFDKSKDLFSES